MSHIEMQAIRRNIFNLGELINKNDWERLDLRNRVKSLEVNHFKASGFIIAVKSKLKEGTEKEQYFFNQKGFIVEKKEYRAEDTEARNTKYKYDGKGKLKKIESDGLITETDYHFSTKKKEIEEVIRNPTNGIGFIYKFYYQFDEEGRVVDIFIKDSQDNILGRENIEFDKDKLKGEIFNLYTDRFWSDRKYLDYNKNYQVLKEKREKQDYSSEHKSTFKYDSYGNIIKRKDLLIEDRGKTRQTVTYKYVYDNNGNWVKRVTFINRNPIELCERTINYMNLKN